MKGIYIIHREKKFKIIQLLSFKKIKRDIRFNLFSYKLNRKILKNKSFIMKHDFIIYEKKFKIMQI